MMEAPNSPLYKACLQEMGQETLTKYNDSEEFCMEMRNAFDRITERVAENEDPDDDDDDDDDGDMNFDQ